MRFISLVLISILFAVNYVLGHKNSPLAFSDFESFKAFHGKQYETPKHEKKAKLNFEKHQADVSAHNEAFAKGLTTFKKELNGFADVDPTEFNKRNGFKRQKKNRQIESVKDYSKVVRQTGQLPATWDWRSSDKVSPVLDQGNCGCCWAFSAVGAMESQVLLQNHSLMQFSEQQLVNCDYTDLGCNGGLYTSAWDYIQTNGGIELSSAYPNTSSSGFGGFFCWYYFKPDPVATVTNYTQVATDYTSIQSALVNSGPLSIAIDASQGLQTYSSGVYQCSQNYTLDHAVLLVGYNTTANPPYWIVKNSWSTTFGYSGFFNLIMGNATDCGMRDDVAFPTVKILPKSG